MKKIAEIKQMENKAIVDAFEGVVTKVFPAKEPSPAQAKHGIHTQTVELSGGNGQLIYIKLLKKHLHLEMDFTGRRFRFESTKDDDDKLGGLVVSKWEDKKQVMNTSVDIWGNASMYCLDANEMNSPQPRQHDQTEQKKLPDATQIPARGHIESYLRLHHACFKIAKAEYHGEGLSMGELKDIATSGAIKFDRNPPRTLGKEIASILGGDLASSAVKIKDEPLVDAAKKEFDAEVVEEKPVGSTRQEDWRLVKDSKGNLISGMDEHNLADLAIKMLPFHANDKPNIKAVFIAVLERRRELNLPYLSIYDVFDSDIQVAFTPDAIQAAWDELLATFKGDEEKTSLEILKDQKTFKTIVENHIK